eukprot:TRINITY_DN3314_c0_g1_i1.p1 TRINITY_DN3314_c0_g1~~TRINITY_DN3314_c0_g1_i1.p1  ORF type:complete len:660 (+),score=140.07 TRINITY_DN3314_c0_g1_i1:96-1982(+)
MAMQLYASDGCGGAPIACEVAADATVADLIDVVARQRGCAKEGLVVEHAAQGALDPAMTLADAGLCSEAVVQVREAGAVAVTLTVQGAFPCNVAEYLNMQKLNESFPWGELAPSSGTPSMKDKLQEQLGKRVEVGIKAGATSLGDGRKADPAPVLAAVLERARVLEEQRRANPKLRPPASADLRRDKRMRWRFLFDMQKRRMDYRMMPMDHLAACAIVESNRCFAGLPEGYRGEEDDDRHYAEERPLEVLLDDVSAKLHSVEWDTYQIRYEVDPPEGITPGSREAKALQALIRITAWMQNFHCSFTLAESSQFEWRADGGLWWTALGIAHPGLATMRKGPYGRNPAWWRGYQQREDGAHHTWTIPWAFCRHIRQAADGSRRRSPQQSLRLRWRTLCSNVCSRTLRRCGVGMTARQYQKGGTNLDNAAMDDFFQVNDIPPEMLGDRSRMSDADPGDSMDSDDFEETMMGEVMPPLDEEIRRVDPGRPFGEYEAALTAAKRAFALMQFRSVAISRTPAGGKERGPPYCCTMEFVHPAPLWFMWVAGNAEMDYGDGRICGSAGTDETSMCELQRNMGAVSDDGFCPAPPPDAPRWVPRRPVQMEGATGADADSDLGSRGGMDSDSGCSSSS